MRGLVAQRVNASWVLAYTAGLTQQQKQRRRDEVQSDMYEEQAFAISSHAGSFQQQRQVLSRMVRGVAGDIAWRWEAGRDAEVAVREGAQAPMPWLSSLFLGAVVAFGAGSTTLADWWDETHVMLAMVAILGAGLTWLGLYLASHRHCGPILVAAGSACIAWCLWWTFVVPVMAVAVVIMGVRRAQRIEHLIEG